MNREEALRDAALDESARNITIEPNNYSVKVELKFEDDFVGVQVDFEDGIPVGVQLPSGHSIDGRELRLAILAMQHFTGPQYEVLMDSRLQAGMGSLASQRGPRGRGPYGFGA